MDRFPDRSEQIKTGQDGQDSSGLSEIQKLRGTIVNQAQLVEHILSPEQKQQLFSTLKARFEANEKRHKGIEWLQVEARLQEAASEKLWSLNEMERTGGEPDVIEIVKETGEVEFWDCSKKSPKLRRMVCYDSKGQENLESQGIKSKGNAVDMAKAMGIGGILNREQIMKLDKLVKDLLKKTSSWVDTPKGIREKEFALIALCLRSVKVEEVYASSFADSVGFHGWLRV